MQAPVKSDKKFSISEMAKHFGVTSRTIRFYEDQGLLNPTRVESQRIYSERDFVRMKLILRGKRIGFSLAELKKTLDLYDTQTGEDAQAEFVLETIKSHRQSLQQKLADIQATLQEMDDIEQRIKNR